MNEESSSEKSKNNVLNSIIKAALVHLGDITIKVFPPKNNNALLAFLAFLSVVPYFNNNTPANTKVEKKAILPLKNEYLSTIDDSKYILIKAAKYKLGLDTQTLAKIENTTGYSLVNNSYSDTTISTTSFYIGKYEINEGEYYSFIKNAN